MQSISPGYGQFRWVVLLLAVAVILPTICLLWFLNAAVRNERLVIRQKLTTFYKNRLSGVTAKVEQKWALQCRTLDDAQKPVHPYHQFVRVVGRNGYDGLILYDDLGRRLYPVLSVEGQSVTRPSEIFADAWELEFVTQEYALAAERYEQYARISDEHGRLAAYIGKSRSLAKLGNIDQAITECRRAAFSSSAALGDSRSLALVANARLLMLNWMQDKPAYAAEFDDTLAQLVTLLYGPNAAGFALPADENLFIARRALEIGGPSHDASRTPERLDGIRLDRLIEAEERSITFAELFPTTDALDGWQPDKLKRLGTDGDTGPYTIMHTTERRTCIAMLDRESMAERLADYAVHFQDANVDYRIYDDAGHVVAGLVEPTTEAFATAPAAAALPGWSIQLFFKDGDVFERAASERIAVYTWTGVLVILLILSSGAVAAKSISKQVKLNKLKNDFIATVTHELKTPLASMRVLVDTLLEGHYRNQQQVTEYLQLVSRENERLSRLIDNFLTFSRMERNKQAFQMHAASPISIAQTAAEAVRTKFSRGNCHFETDIPEDLPAVTADHDAMVTVLVNLLDNAYKYSFAEKRITLRVTSDNGSVCFSVTDNGAGIPRRAAKKIFRRFYQVDRSLSRRAEGCGLGLSIARFIVDAHVGKIAVESKPGQGSTFTVTLPAAPRA